jgi:hypothetical protein
MKNREFNARQEEERAQKGMERSHGGDTNNTSNRELSMELKNGELNTGKEEE